MSSVQTSKVPLPTNIAPELDHYVCEDCGEKDEIALCGTDVSGMGPWRDGNPKCIVCVETETCPSCGDELLK